MPDKRGGKKKYIKLKVFRDRIEQTISDEKLEFETNNAATTTTTTADRDRDIDEPFCACCEVFNYGLHW